MSLLPTPKNLLVAAVVVFGSFLVGRANATHDVTVLVRQELVSIRGLTETLLAVEEKKCEESVEELKKLHRHYEKLEKLLAKKGG